MTLLVGPDHEDDGDCFLGARSTKACVVALEKALKRTGRVRGFMGRRGGRKRSWGNSFVGIASVVQ